MIKPHNYFLMACGLLTYLGAPSASAAGRSVTDKPYAAKADMKLLTDAAIPAGSKTLSSASAMFTTADAGKSLVVAEAPPAQLRPAMY